MTTQHPDLHLHRLRQIAQTLVRHGLGYLVGVLGLERLVPFHHGLLGHARRTEPYTQPEHVRMALEELGATFIKLGQILSTRADLLPPAYQAELAKLQDQAPPVPAEQIQAVLAEELGRPIDAVFATFDPVPLAAASIGQAHAATLPDGTEVVVKVRRPGVVEQVEEDLDILQQVASVASRRWQLADRYDVVGLAREFAQTLRAELDYVREGHNAERFAENFASDGNVHIPRVYWEASTARVLTLERIRGIKIDDLAALDAAGIDRCALAERATRVLLKMVFEDGFFHADPHPGNFFVEPDGRLGLIDFGMVGTMDAPTQEHLVNVLLAVTHQDADALVDAFLALGVARHRVDRELLRADLQQLVSRYYGRPLDQIAIGPVLADAQAVARRHYLQLPPNLALLLKTVAMSEGLGRRLCPQFNLTTALAPFAERLVRQRYSPLQLARRLAEVGLETARLGEEMPRQFRRIIADLEGGRLQVGIRPEGFEPLLRRAERLTNRLVLGIITAAFVNGLAVLMAVYHPAGDERWLAAFFAIGFVVASVLGIYLAWSILHPGRD